MSGALTEGLQADLLELLGDRWQVSSSESVLEQHSRGLTYHRARNPDVVVFPQTVGEVQAVISYANERRVPVTAFGMGTSVEGQIVPTSGGISLDLTRMDSVLAVRAGDLQADVQPGVRRSQLDAAAGEHGLFFPVDPGADATLGGMAATNASGTTTVRYGGMRSQVLALEVVLADGTIIRPGGRAVKSSAGYNLTGLFVGSEGTLGIITQLTLRLYPIPDYAAVVQAAFPDPEAAFETAAVLIGSGVLISRCEYVDGGMIAMMNAHRNRDYPASPHLWIEFSGASETVVAGDLAAAREICDEHGCPSFVAETDRRRRAALWATRHDAVHALEASAPGKTLFLTDVCVPISQLPAAFKRTPELLADSGLHGCIVGHVGDGNYHLGLAIDPEDPAELSRAQALNRLIVEDALARGGSCTGEHGIGSGKRSYLEREHSDCLPVMRIIKQALDPRGILNPGKIL